MTTYVEVLMFIIRKMLQKCIHNQLMMNIIIYNCYWLQRGDNSLWQISKCTLCTQMYTVLDMEIVAQLHIIYGILMVKRNLLWSEIVLICSCYCYTRHSQKTVYRRASKDQFALFQKYAAILDDTILQICLYGMVM